MIMRTVRHARHAMTSAEFPSNHNACQVAPALTAGISVESVQALLFREFHKQIVESIVEIPHVGG